MSEAANPTGALRRGPRLRSFELVVGAIAVGTVVGLVVLWPGESTPR